MARKAVAAPWLVLLLQGLAHPGDTVNFKNAQKLNHVFKCKRDRPLAPFEDF